MISFNLTCDNDHDFDGWFSSTQDFEGQKKRSLVSCPVCGSAAVTKSLMAPTVTTGRQKEKMAVATVDANRQAIAAELKSLRDKMTVGAEDVGRRFPEEARKIHYGESEERGIYGEANRDEVEGLLEEGVDVIPLPAVPEDAN